MILYKVKKKKHIVNSFSFVAWTIQTKYPKKQNKTTTKKTRTSIKKIETKGDGNVTKFRAKSSEREEKAWVLGWLLLLKKNVEMSL